MNSPETTELQLPHFEDITGYLSEYVVELLYTLEHLFNDVDYHCHQDDLTILYNTHPDATSADRANMVTSCYREHIGLLLARQGIMVKDPYTEKLSDLIELVKGCNLIGTFPLDEILVYAHVNTDVTPDEFFASIISEITELNIPAVLSLVSDITESTIEYLHNNVPVPHLETHTANISRDRFMEYLPTVQHKGVVVNAIKQINHFDYDPFQFIYSIHEDLVNMEEKDVAVEIVLMLLGSHVTLAMLRVTALQIVDLLNLSLDVQMRLNGFIAKTLNDYEAMK